MTTLNSLVDLNRIANHVSRVAASQALVSLVRDYNELDDATVNKVKDRVQAAYQQNWVGEKRQKFWGEALMAVNRFWGEHFKKGDDLARQSIAFPIIAKFFTDNDVRNAWNAVMLGYIERAGFGDCTIYESLDSGHQLILRYEGKQYSVSPAGIVDVTETGIVGTNIAHEFSVGTRLNESISAEDYVEGAIENDNYYYRALAVYSGMLDELDGSIGLSYGDLVVDLEIQRKRQCAISALMIARTPNASLSYAVAGLSVATSLLMDANLGKSKLVNNLKVHTVPLDIANHQFIMNFALSELARKLKERGYNVEKHPYPELVAVVSNLAVQVIHHSADKANPIIYWNEPLCDKFVDLIYGLGEGVKASAAVVAAADGFRTLVENAAKILTVVYKNQIRC